MDDKIFRDQYILEIIIVWLIDLLELNLIRFDPSARKKWKNVPPGKKYTLR